jgi:hypothetical protein
MALSVSCSTLDLLRGVTAVGETSFDVSHFISLHFQKSSLPVGVGCGFHSRLLVKNAADATGKARVQRAKTAWRSLTARGNSSGSPPPTPAGIVTGEAWTRCLRRRGRDRKGVSGRERGKCRMSDRRSLAALTSCCPAGSRTICPARRLRRFRTHLKLCIRLLVRIRSGRGCSRCACRAPVAHFAAGSLRDGFAAGPSRNVRHLRPVHPRPPLPCPFVGPASPFLKDQQRSTYGERKSRDSANQ